MIILPAIDILDGKPVRLYQGDYEKQEQVGQDILSIAKQFEQAGACYMHMVDLNGAKQGRRINHEQIVQVASQLKIPVEVGGGIRTMEDVDYYLTHSVARVILGTSALKNPDFLKEAIQKYGDRIAVGIDCKNDKVCLSGWLDQTEKDYLEFAKELEQIGVKTLIVTDISKDGTMQGPNINMLKKLQENVSCQCIASGGIKDLSHIQALKALSIYGAITGKALYAHTLDLKEALEETV